MRKAVVLLMVLAVIGLAVPCFAGSESMTLYDDFNKKAINAFKWTGQENESDSNHRVIREAVRQIEGQQLHLGVCAKATCTDCGNTDVKYGQNRLKVRTTNTFTALKATVKVNAVTLVGGTLNATPPAARARVYGFFFNDGTSTGQTDSTGDVYAYISLGKASDSATASNRVNIEGYVNRCKEASCVSTEPVSSSPVSLGTVPIGQPVTLYVEWDKAGHKFIFQKIKGQTIKDTEEISYAGILNDTAAPVNASNYRLDVIGVVPNDTTVPGSLKAIPAAAIDANFDDVYFNN
ncbi:MAG: hypothetical protein ABFD97_03235 [Syntrophobacter sp.]